MELMNSSLYPRRALLNRVAPALAGSLAAISPARMVAGNRNSPKANRAIKSGAANIRAKKGDVSLYIYRKKLDATKPGEPASPVLFLAHRFVSLVTAEF